MIVGIDIATRRTGWCAGTGSARPAAGVWTYAHVEEDLGLLGEMFDRDLGAMADRFAPTHIIYESPILLPSDRLLPLRKIYGMGFHLETWGRKHGIIVKEEGPRALKKLLTGNSKAEKSEMVLVAKRLGISLPDGEGAKDAADAFACWMCGLTHYAKEHQPKWDRALYSPRGRLDL